jgi:lipopolysaccharide transport system ATP-binding protein
MSDIVIKAENLGKKYIIGHQAEKGRYIALRDVMAHGVRTLWNKTKDLAKGKAIIQGDKTEEVWALKDVSFEIPRGESVGIIGDNGAGKSTLLKILSRITEPSAGRVTIKGRVASLLEVGTGFHQEMTGRENIILNGAILGMTRAEVKRKFDEIVDFAEIEKFLDTPVKRYSSGMYVRLAFAVAAHLEPEILLVDEVLAVGDAAFQKKCLGKMGDVAKKGRTVLFVSHNMNAVEQLCRAGLLLDRGRVKLFSRDVKHMVREYLLGPGTNRQSSEWVNTGNKYDNPWFKPIRFFAADENGVHQTMPVSNDKGTWIHIEAQIKESDPALTIGYAIYAEDGNLLYWSYQTDTAEHTWPRLDKGFRVLRSRIPPRFLNEGLFRIELISSLHFREWLLAPGNNGPFITVSIRGGLSDSPLWIAKRPGLIAPVIEWDIVK